jgi:hypothetical protein
VKLSDDEGKAMWGDVLNDAQKRDDQTYTRKHFSRARAGTAPSHSWCGM